MKPALIIECIFNIIIYTAIYFCGYYSGLATKEKEIKDKLFMGKAVQTISYPEFDKLINNN